MRRPALTVLLALAAGASLVSCGSSGRELRQPVDGAVSPTRPTSTTVAPLSLGGSIAVPFTLTSTAFADGDTIPADHSCKGPSPELHWSGVPAGTTELALVVVDETDDGFVHWLVTGIAPSIAAVAEGQAPPGAVQHANSAGGIGWYGPCREVNGDPPHVYSFTLMALPGPSNIAAATPATDAVAALDTQVNETGSATAVLTGTFGGDSPDTSPGSGVSPTLGTAPGTTRRR